MTSYMFPTRERLLSNRIDIINQNISDDTSSPVLERMADYIIMSDEGKELNHNSDDRALSMEYLEKKLRREQFKEGAEFSPREHVLFHYPYKDRYSLSSIEITEADLNDDRYSEYKKLYDSVDNSSSINKFKRDGMKHDIESDMIQMKKSFNNIPEKNNESIYHAYIDIFNELNINSLNHKQLSYVLGLSNTEVEFGTDLYYIKLSIDSILNELEISKTQSNIVFLMRKGYNIKEMIDVTGNSKRVIGLEIKKLLKNINTSLTHS